MKEKYAAFLSAESRKNGVESVKEKKKPTDTVEKFLPLLLS